MISGSIVAQANPMSSHGALSMESLDRFATRHLQSGTQDTARAKATGNCSSMTVGERIKVARRVTRQSSWYLQVASGFGRDTTVEAVALIPIAKNVDSISRPCILVLFPKTGLHKRLVSARPSSPRRCQLRKFSIQRAGAHYLRHSAQSSHAPVRTTQLN
jgi:hypothetical protein